MQDLPPARHFEGDPAIYKPKEEQEAWLAKDPLPRFAQFLAENGVLTAEELAEIDAQVAKEVEDAIVFCGRPADTDSGERRRGRLFRHS